MTAIQIELSDFVAEQARRAGLLAPEKLEQLLREELRRQAGEWLQEHVERVDALGGEPMSMDEIQQEVLAVRAERRRRR